jgi:serine/threonine protein phosphatase PrpC
MAGQLVSCVTADRPMAATQVSPTLEEGAWFVPHAGDVILLCSDGVTGELPEPELTSLACGSGKAAERCEAIVAAVLATPARDNASVVVAVVGGSA